MENIIVLDDSFINANKNGFEITVEDGILKSFKQVIQEKVIIDLKNVSEVADGVFAQNNFVTKVNLPNAKKIGNKAFYQAIFLEEVKLESCYEIGKSVFEGTVSLKTVDAPKLEVLPANSFGFSNVQKLNLPNLKSVDNYSVANARELEIFNAPNLENIGPKAFSNCVKLQKITSNNIKKIEQQAFETCMALFDLNTEKVEYAHRESFSLSMLVKNDQQKNNEYVSYKNILLSSKENSQNINLKNITVIAAKAFWQDQKVQKVTSKSVKFVNEQAFYQSSLVKLKLWGVKKIDNKALCETKLAGLNSFWLKLRFKKSF
ncbi:leucine-rich repeat domain-containing protein [[Mycoplasma] gypis]|uniref:Leucine-rich repeat domain-containing protein n=1 Tax=[Mycoplasma] gypis TaxID=92404 RepID=A0ABZ2RV88_9BACT|nr:leucine-rich repeat domain-containing protein [[Mycoplasma] gypis]MBN0919279.1 leucine-rich repeat domain-containing protein [[Mycoplasma] gypis]